MSDELVPDVIVSHDVADFAEFAAARWAGLVRLAYGLTGDRWIAEDIAQTALARAYASWWRVSRADDPDDASGHALASTPPPPLYRWVQFRA
ncbi:MAG: hypothetical protein JOY82_04890 [Streptosporangiaceae bacterium]|nr:hypothetical protein [Streptosporangiaceae bacterium]MBV9853844.1 hypothetical protein [Streptosporangiaceae bacterium]